MEVKTLREVCARLVNAAKKFEAVIKEMNDDGRTHLIMENAVSATKSSKAALSSANKAQDALDNAREMGRLVQETIAEEDKKRGKKKG